MNGSARKQAELTAKIDSIDAELKFWFEASRENGKWEKHHSQIQRVGTQIDTAAKKLRTALDTAVRKDVVVSEARWIERLVIDLHSVWEFFRSKLLLRATDPFKSYLEIADEFAWACYEPALLRV